MENFWGPRYRRGAHGAPAPPVVNVGAAPCGRPRAAEGGGPYDDADHVGRGLLDAPDLPLGGKVARPEAVTDEGATYRAFSVNGIPQSPPCGGDSPLSQGGLGRTHRSAPTGDNGPEFS